MKEFKKINSCDLDVLGKKHIKMDLHKDILKRSSKYLTDKQLQQYQFSTLMKYIYRWNRFRYSKGSI